MSSVAIYPATEFVSRWLQYHQSYPQGAYVAKWPFIIRSEKADAFGRYLVEAA